MFSLVNRWFGKHATPNAQSHSSPALARSGSQAGLQFDSPASTSVDELVALREQAQALRRDNKRKSHSKVAGPSMSRQLGRGLDFAEVREYQAGDDVRMIDWKVTARTGKTHTKLFVEERERPIMIVVDMRSSMRFATQGMFKSVMAARLGALLGWNSVANLDRVGGFVFTDDWHTEVRPLSGRRGLMNLFRSIAQAQTHAPSAGTNQLSDSLSRLRKAVHSGSTVFLLSDFIGFDDQTQMAMGNLLQRLDIIAVHIVDSLETQLPASGRYAVKNMHDTSDTALAIDTSSKTQKSLYAQRQAEHQLNVQNFFAKHNHLYFKIQSNDDLLDSVVRIIHRQPDFAPHKNDEQDHEQAESGRRIKTV